MVATLSELRNRSLSFQTQEQGSVFFSLLPAMTRRSGTHGGEFHTACPLCCSATNSLVIWPGVNRFWCRECRAHGDAIQFLRYRDGLSFHQACHHLGLYPQRRLQPRVADPQVSARKAATASYESWRDEKCQSLHERRRLLEAERIDAELFFRLCQKFPHLFDDGEHALWVRRLGTLYDRLAVLESEIQSLCDPWEQAEQFKSWQEEGERHD